MGIIAYEMTVGRVPFHDSDTPVAVLLRQVNETIPAAVSVDPTIDKRFSDWIDHMLAKEPADRVRDAREAWYELEEIAVAMLGPMWRREAALGGGEGATLDPAKFDRRTTEPADADGYETFGGGTAGAAPVPETEAEPEPEPEAAPEPETPPESETIAPAASAAAVTAYETYQPDTPATPPPPVEATPTEPAPDPEPVATPEPQPAPVEQEPEPATDPALTPTTAPAAVSGSETFQWPSSSRRGGGSGRRLGVGLAIVGLVIVAAVAAVALRSQGSSSTTSSSSLPTLTADPSKFVAGKLDTAAGFDGQAWLVKDGSSLLNVEDTSQTIQPPRWRRERALLRQRRAVDHADDTGRAASCSR